MIRTFHSVGQGAFYTEKFDQFTMIYDCGSNKANIDKEIKSTFNKGDNVNVLFISHFHADHVNGLDTLLQWCNVKYVILPLLTDATKIELYLESYKLNNKFINDLIIEPSKTINNISSETKVIYVRPFDILNENDENEKLDLSDLFNEAEIDSGTKIHNSNIGEWLFVPSNYEVSNRVKELTSKLNKLKFDVSTTDGFIKNWKKPPNRKLIKSCFNSLKGNPNQNSMTLYSGANSEGVKIDHIHRSMMLGVNDILRAFYHNEGYRSGCLYFGDYEAKDSELWSYVEIVYSKYWEDIDTIQIPHHGSIDNYNSEINSRDHVISVISTGTKNSYKHPSSHTTSEIIRNKGILCNVTEIPTTRVQYYVNER